MQKLLTTILIFLLVVSGCNSTKNSENSYEPGTTIEAFFCPEDNCEQLFLTKIENANEKVQCAFFDLDSSPLIKKIAEKSNTIPIEIVLDDVNYDNQIVGESITIANAKQYMHNKFCILDNNEIITGSANPTDNGFHFNNNNILVSNSKMLIVNYKNEFQELKKGIYGSGQETKQTIVSANSLIIENYFCPEDNCKNQVRATLQSAKESIYFMTFSFTDEDIADILVLKDNEIDIKGVIESRNANGIGSQFQRLIDFGLTVKKDGNPKAMHHKVFVVDAKTVITGSYNPTKGGNERNDENILIIHNEDIASEFLDEFEKVYLEAGSR